MARKSSIERHVVTSGNLPMATAGKPLYTCPVKGKQVFYNVAPGQLVAFTEEIGQIPVIVDKSTLDSTHIPTLKFGVGLASDDGAVHELRLVGADDISGCHLDSASVSGPKCGTPEVKDFFFDCTKCNETYSLRVKYDDNSTRSYAPAYKSSAEVTGSVFTECHSCNDCAPEHNCKEVACKLVDAINNERELKIGDNLYPDWKQGNGVKFPFRAVRLHERSLVYCISPRSIECSVSYTHLTLPTKA